MSTEIKYLTKKEAIEAVNKSGGNLEYCTPELQNDEEVVMAAIKNDPVTFKYASQKLKSNKTFIINNINQYCFWSLMAFSSLDIQSDIEVMALALEADEEGWIFTYAKGPAAINKELAAKALIKYSKCHTLGNNCLWDKLDPTLKQFFPKDSWLKKSQSYLHQLEQEKQAKMVSGGCTEEDETVW